MKKNYINLQSMLLFIFTLIAFISLDKTIYIAPRLNISACLLIYPFTFLIVAKLYDNYDIKTSKQAIYSSFILLLIFYLLITAVNSINGITSSELITNSLRTIFTPETITINNLLIYYPNIINLLTYALIFFISHYIFIVAYEAIEPYTNYFISFILAILLSFILDQILFIPLINLPSMISEFINYQLLIENITASFIAVLFSSIIMLLLFVVTKKRN